MNTLASAIKFAINNALYSINTCLPCQILTYDYKTQRASVQISLNKKFINGTEQAAPIVSNVPVVFPRSFSASLTFPLLPGDPCLLLFSQRSLDSWKKIGGQITPDDFRKFDLSDAIAIPGLYSFNQESPAPNNSDVSLKLGQVEVRLQPENKLAIGNQTTEVLKVISDLLGYLSTSLTTSNGAPIDKATDYAALKSSIDALRGSL